VTSTVRKSNPAKAARPSEELAFPAQQARSRATRERLLRAAEKVFAEKGYEGARLADIAEEAGCSVGAVYFRFKDKDALFMAIAEDFAQTSRELMPLLLVDGDSATMIRTAVWRTTAQFRLHRGLFRAILERGFEQPRLTQAIFALRDEAGATFEAALRGAGVRRPDLSLAVRVGMQMLHGFLLTGILNPRAPANIDDDRAIEEMADVLVAHLGT
jgi:AcrR family transcriptional regulator